MFQDFFLCSFQTSPLQRMVTGGLFAGLAFVCSGILERELEKSYPVNPFKNEAALNIVNTLPCRLTFKDPSGNERSVLEGDMVTLSNIPIRGISPTYSMSVSALGCGQMDVKRTRLELAVEERKVYFRLQ